jgi:hypothetical protein
MATFVKINKFVDHLCSGVHNFNSQGTAAMTVALSNTQPATEGGGDPLSDAGGDLSFVTEINYANLSSRAFATVSKNLSAGTLTVDLSDLVLTASGAVAAFRYLYFYNDTPTAPVDPLVAHFDHGSVVQLADTDTYSISIDNAGLFTLA